MEREVQVRTGAATLEGTLTVPPRATGVVLFAHGSGSGRHSPRNRRVAARLQQVGMATLLFDLLTPEEGLVDERTGAYRFDIPRLAGRLAGAVDWVAREPDTASLAVGCFGASTGAAAALIAAALRPTVVRAVVSRGGRPDLAGTYLGQVRAPTLLIVGGADPEVLALNHAAAARLLCEVRVEVVPGATHLFEEPGTLDRVIDLAAGWFAHRLVPVPA